jgi:hypothetical protein
MPTINIAYTSEFGNPAHLESARAELQQIIAEELSTPDSLIQPHLVGVNINPSESITDSKGVSCSCSITITGTKPAGQVVEKIWKNISDKIREIGSLKDPGHLSSGDDFGRGAQRIFLSLFLQDIFEDQIPMFYPNH